MMWLCNILCCFFLYSCIGFSYLIGRTERFLQAAMFGYFCCPVLKIGLTSINGTYFITLLLLVISLNEGCKRRIKLTGWSLYFFLFQIGAMILVLTAGFANGVINRSLIAALAGQINIGVGVLCSALLLKLVERPEQVLKKAIFYASVSHAALGLIQLASVEWGYVITSQLFASSDRQAPLNTMLSIGNFYRIMGAGYSPTILGGYVLIAFSFVLTMILTEKGRRIKRELLLLAVTLLLGLLAFSKTVILGIFVVSALEILWVFFNRKQCNWKALKKCLLAVAGMFTLVIVISYPTRLWGQVQYYFGKILMSPTTSLNSRYGNGLFGISVDILSSKELISSYANTTYLSIALIKEHPFLGVGLLPVVHEFIGDSQYISIFHYGGIFLFMLFTVFYGGLLWNHFKAGNMQQFMVLIAIGLCGISMNSLEISLTVPFLGYCLSGRTIQSGRKYEKESNDSDTDTGGRWSRTNYKGSCMRY